MYKYIKIAYNYRLSPIDGVANKRHMTDWLRIIREMSSYIGYPWLGFSPIPSPLKANAGNNSILRPGPIFHHNPIPKIEPILFRVMCGELPSTPYSLVNRQEWQLLVVRAHHWAEKPRKKKFSIILYRLKLLVYNSLQTSCLCACVKC